MDEPLKKKKRAISKSIVLKIKERPVEEDLSVEKETFVDESSSFEEEEEKPDTDAIKDSIDVNVKPKGPSSTNAREEGHVHETLTEGQEVSVRSILMEVEERVSPQFISTSDDVNVGVAIDVPPTTEGGEEGSNADEAGLSSSRVRSDTKTCSAPINT